MAVFTQISAKEMALFIGRYAIGAYLQHIGLVAGSTNSTFLVETTNGKYIATLFEDHAEEDAHLTHIACVNHLALHNVPVPKILHTRQGTFVQPLAGKTAIVQEFKHGQPLSAPQAMHSQRAGAMLAITHNTNPKGRLPLPTNALGQEAVHKLLLECEPLAAKSDAAASALPLLLQESLRQQQVWANLPPLPNGLCHGDYFIDTVFFDTEGHVSGVIDWWCCCHEAFVYDLAIALCAWGFDDSTGALLPAHFQAFLQGYANRRQLDDDEQAVLNWALRRAALRFCATRLFDKLTAKGFTANKPWQPWFNRLKNIQQEQQGFLNDTQASA